MRALRCFSSSSRYISSTRRLPNFPSCSVARWRDGERREEGGEMIEKDAEMKEERREREREFKQL